MRNKEHFLFTTLVYCVFLLVLGIMGSISFDNKNKVIEDNNNYNFESNTPTNNQEKIESVFEDNVEVSNIQKFNNNYIAYGSKDNNPYISILNDEQNVILNESKYTKQLGSFTDILYNGLYFNTTIKQDNIDKSVDLFLSGNTLIPYHKKQLNINYTKGRIITPKYLVIHETANTSVGADAEAHYKYWSTNPTANASTHFVVDSNEIYQMLELNQMAWHVGDNKGYSDITNTNSIGIEISVNKDGNYELTRLYTIDLTIAIMNKLNMSIDQLKIHRDASGKFDPIIMLTNNLWDDFVNQVKAGLNN